MNENIKTFRLGELFCGPGGLALGAMNASISNPEYKIVHEWANDYDASTCDTYRRNICPDNGESVICGDVRKLDIDSLGPIDAFAFGFPCNDFSVVGEQKGFDGTYGPLYTYGVKVLKKYQPLWFLAENVGGIKSANAGKAFQKIQKDLIAAGYKIYPNLYKFEEYGVPQARHRMIIVGIRKDIPFEYKVPSTEPYKNIDVTCKTAMEHARAYALSGCKRIMTIENKANYEDMSYRKDTLYIFCHGFFSPKEVRFLKTICDLVSEECEFYHWGDLDYGGICIFQFIKAQVFPKLLPYKMSQEDFELAVREDAGILLKEDTRNKLIRKNAGLLEPLKEAILKSGLTIEQERLL